MEDFTFTRPHVNRVYQDKYPWDEWIGKRGSPKTGKEVTLVSGRHFTVKMSSVRQAALNAAGRRFIKISTEKKDSQTLVIHVLGHVQ